MKGRMNTGLGEIVINPDVIALYAGSVAVECFGIVGMAAVNMKDGLVKLLKKESLTHGINVSISENKISLDFHVIVSYGVSISAVTDNLINNVKYKVEEFTGNSITPEKLGEAIRIINNKRKAMARVYNARKSECLPISGRDVLLMTQISFFDDPVRCAEMCNRLADELEQRIKDGVSVVPEGTKRILVTGTPMAVPNWKLHNIIETSGAAVVCEEMCTGTRYFENLVDETKTTLDDQFMALSERYMKTNCACFTPNHGRIDDLLRMVKEYKVDGVIDCSLKFCCLYDTEKYSVARALKEAGVPVLGLETDYTDTDAEQLRTRIGAFIEMLNNR